MSVAIAVESEGGVWMATDSRASCEGFCVDGQLKMRRIDEGAIAWAGGGLFDAYFLGFEGVEDGIKLETFPLTLRQHIASCDIAVGDDNGFELLLAYRGAVFQLDDSFCMTRDPRGYAAIGSGSDYALGYRFGQPNTRPGMAVQAAIEFDPACGGAVQEMWVPA